jgi:hypothetical protein
MLPRRQVRALEWHQSWTSIHLSQINEFARRQQFGMKDSYEICEQRLLDQQAALTSERP